jgi:hypothetical protein
LHVPYGEENGIDRVMVTCSSNGPATAE